MGVGAAIGAGIQGVQAINSGVQGKRAQRQLNEQVNKTNEMYGGMLDAATGIMDQFTGMAGQFQNPGMAADVTNAAYQLGDQLTGIATNAANQIGQGGGTDMARQAAQGGFDFSSMFNQLGQMQQFGFDPVQQNLQQATQFAQDSAARARQLASDQAGLAMRQGEDALNAQLAARGLSGTSGAAAAGLANLHQQNAMTRAQLEGQLADQAGMMGLQAAQLDTANLLQHSGLSSQYNLGMNQLQSQNILQGTGMASQYDLGNRQLAGNLGLGLQQLNDQQALQRAGLMSDAATTGFGALQGTYQQNYLAPMLQMQSILGGLGGQLANVGATGMMNNTQLGAEGVKQAGSGKGSALGGVTSALQDWNPTIPGKGNGGGGGANLTTAATGPAVRLF